MASTSIDIFVDETALIERRDLDAPFSTSPEQRRRIRARAEAALAAVQPERGPE